MNPDSTTAGTRLGRRGWAVVAVLNLLMPPARLDSIDLEAVVAVWPQFRGPNSQGQAERSDPPVVFGPGTNLAWKIAVAPGLASPVVAADRVFLASVEAGCLLASAHSLSNGRVLWRREMPPRSLEPCHPAHGPASASPATDGERVFFAFGSVGVVARDLEGAECWRREWPVVPVEFGSASSPVLAGDCLVLVRDLPAGRGELIALDRRTGATRWSTPRVTEDPTWSTPVVRSRAGLDEVLVLGAGTLAAYRLSDGKKAWEQAGFSSMPIGVPALGEAAIFVGAAGVFANSDRGLRLPGWHELAARFDPDGDGRIRPADVPEADRFVQRPDLAPGQEGHSVPARALFQRKSDALGAYADEESWNRAIERLETREGPTFVALHVPGPADAAMPARVWESHRGVPEIPSPLAFRDRVYLVRNGGLLKCVAAEDGRVVYDERLGAGGQYAASPVVASDRIYVASEGGVVTVVRGGDRFEVLARNGLGERLMATPAPVGRKLLVRTERHLWAFE